MGNTVRHYVATHKKVDWVIPFPHRLITLDGYSEPNALDASSILPREMLEDRTFAFYRAGWVAVADAKDMKDDDFICLEGYRSYFGTQLSADVHRTVVENPSELSCAADGLRTFMTPSVLQETWMSSILEEVPTGVDLIISRPVAFPCTMLEQYAVSHPIEDLLLGLGLAVRIGVLNEATLPRILNSNYFINNFVGRVSFFRKLYSFLYKVAFEFYSKLYIRRTDYQSRVINFILERIVSIYLIEKVYFEGVSTLTVNLNQITEDGIYRPGA
jgi:Domain of unknown function (DUF4422)